MLLKLTFSHPSRPYPTNISSLKANHVEHSLAIFFYCVYALQPSLHRKPIMTHVQHSLATFCTLSILYNHSSIESLSLLMYNIPWPHFFYSVHPLQPSLHRTSIMTHVQRSSTICFYFAYPLQPSLYRKPTPTPVQRSSAILSALLISTYPTNNISFLHRKQMMTRVQPSLAQLIPPHASFHCCTFLLTLLSNILASSKFRNHSYPQILIISSLSQYPRLLSW